MVSNNMASAFLADRRCKLGSIADRFFIANLIGKGIQLSKAEYEFLESQTGKILLAVISFQFLFEFDQPVQKILGPIPPDRLESFFL
jgi:hypothetical protein